MQQRGSPKVTQTFSPTGSPLPPSSGFFVVFLSSFSSSFSHTQFLSLACFCGAISFILIVIFSPRDYHLNLYLCIIFTFFAQRRVQLHFLTSVLLAFCVVLFQRIIIETAECLRKLTKQLGKIEFSNSHFLPRLSIVKSKLKTIL